MQGLLGANKGKRILVMSGRSGVLLAISSIPSKYGIGGFSKEAYEFVDYERIFKTCFKLLKKAF